MFAGWVFPARHFAHVLLTHVTFGFVFRTLIIQDDFIFVAFRLTDQLFNGYLTALTPEMFNLALQPQSLFDEVLKGVGFGLIGDDELSSKLFMREDNGPFHLINICWIRKWQNPSE